MGAAGWDSEFSGTWTGSWLDNSRSCENADSNDGSRYNKWNDRWFDHSRSCDNAGSNDGSWYNKVVGPQHKLRQRWQQRQQLVQQEHAKQQV